MIWIVSFGDFVIGKVCCDMRRKKGWQQWVRILGEVCYLDGWVLAISVKELTISLALFNKREIRCFTDHRRHAWFFTQRAKKSFLGYYKPRI